MQFKHLMEAILPYHHDAVVCDGVMKRGFVLQSRRKKNSCDLWKATGGMCWRLNEFLLPHLKEIPEFTEYTRNMRQPTITFRLIASLIVIKLPTMISAR